MLTVILNRLVKAGKIKRLTRGVFLKPNSSKEVISPALLEIIRTRIPKETISMHGAEAARLLLLTTQMPMKSVFYTTGHTRSLLIGKRIVYLEHTRFNQTQLKDTITGMVIAALNYIGVKNANPTTIHQIKTYLAFEDFQTVLEAAPMMPTWMANLFYQYKRQNDF